MFFVFTKRVVKVNTGATEKFAPRTSNCESWSIDGPFAKRQTAERAAVSALGTHTCLSAQVITADVLREIAKKQEHSYGFYAKQQYEVIQFAAKHHLPQQGEPPAA